MTRMRSRSSHRFALRRLTAITIAALALGALAAPVLAAEQPVVHEVRVPFSGAFDVPAGYLCDFNYQQTYSGLDTFTVFYDATTGGYTVQVLEQGTDTNTNLDTGASLTESISYHYTFYADGGWMQAGVVWQLRAPDGQLVVMHAGQIVFSFDGTVTSFTPNAPPTDPATFAAVICPALGGNPA